MVLFMAGISAIPTQLYEAARIDGAGEWKICRYVTLPMLKPTFIISATLSIIGSLKYFDLVYLMAGGVPEESRELMATYIYRLAFENYQGRFGYGSAAAVALLLISLLVVIPTQKLRRRATDSAG
jgi:raffinose/stachyose/melibiose transport system permease protein